MTGAGLYEELYEKELWGEPYQGQKEYVRDLYRMAEAYFHVAFRLAQAKEEEEQNLISLRKELALELVEIRRHIAIRTEESAVFLEPAFSVMYKRQNWTEFEKFCVLLGSLHWMKQDSGQMFAQLQKGKQHYITRELAVSLFGMGNTLPEEEFDRCRSGNGIWKTCFQSSGQEGKGEVWRFAPVILKPEWMFLFGGEKRLPELAAKISKLWEWKQKPEELLLYQQEKKRLLLLEQHPQIGRVVGICGKSGSGRVLLLKHVSYENHRNLLIVDAKKLDGSCLEEQKQSLILSSTLYDAGICVVLPEQSQETPQQELLEELAKEVQPLYVTSESMPPLSSGYVTEQVEIHLQNPVLSQKVELWNYFLNQYPKAEVMEGEIFANRYVLNPGEIKQTLRTAFLTARGHSRESLTEEDVVEAVKRYNRDRLGDYAASMKTVYTWEDLIVEESVENRLRHICNQVLYKAVVGEQWGFYRKRPYGRGISALFYGPSGTGKTMAAQVMAHELGMELYRIDISRMTSKYIGETQKNITSLFEKAKNINALLFFDEADAFFAKRTEVSNANDRHANSEVAHLLQQMEEYEGIVILATNLKGNLDDAFKRRIKFMIDFRLPNAAARKRLWIQILPAEAPREPDLDLEFFAEHFELSGSDIKEILLQAAFMAAAENTAIGNKQIKEALILCAEKYGRILNPSDFAYLI